MSTTLYNQACLGVVLAGGKSSRMGTDKALLMRENTAVNGQARGKENMLSYSKNLLKNIGVNNIVVSGYVDGTDVNSVNYVTDQFADLGPMGGIYSVIKKYQPKSLLILPVDLPLMTKETLAQLKIKGELAQKACFFIDHFLPLYLPNNAFVEQFFTTHFMQYLQGNTSGLTKSNSKIKKGPSIRSMFAQVPYQALAIKSSQCLFNSNTPQEWQQAQLGINSLSKKM
ncbi:MULTISPECIES: molybdenum cofactor guanylyltransferase [unclassified Colwellia]|uniref:molybdenum cofactor guanylyltransferase n=1 Tax=unclassified Colwellia TaxID=196834 RepID=UPI0015F5A2AF|nr:MULTISPECIES: molybdenum cofactor guanylyltransferase [unclassified Colwellia]MBA6233182.1 molybdenum cofactor guanylyltransferase [Colwellia sp. MB02u-7]MBA6236272.1 molybdenum cofactor guanylyltransferase [Colwellia sp. MB02u-11]MBA6256811.1 molybdenum cofactor guanylyltransferase [Colwellia sp. MB3u-28]MBA6261183.1 molybdenum cofactor guanylyltransferase [Colwellia sp. MB3u-41]MBA6298328.1 molybdenum cofactor guanylyltransferase [Colwellia sp. MB3u-22]